MNIEGSSSKTLVGAMLMLAASLALISCAPRPPAHGTVYTIQIDTNQIAGINDRSEVLTRTQQVLARRLYTLDVRGFIEPLDDTRLLVKVPEMAPVQLRTVRRALAAAGLLEFRVVHEESDKLVAANIVDPGYEVLRQEVRQPDGSTTVKSYLVNKKPERGLTGKYIQRATVTRHPMTKEPEISFELSPEGAKLFEEVTTQYSPKGKRYYQLAIVLDGMLYSAPRILGPIPGGRGQITGDFNLKEAMALANVLENPLEHPHRIIDEKAF